MSDAKSGSLGMTPSACPRYLSHVLQRKARAAREAYKRWVEQHTLIDHGWWKLDVQQVQKVFPGTAEWLMSCASAEGGWGRFVQNSAGGNVWGWLQFAPGTFSGFVSHAIFHLRQRGYIIPRSAWALDSTLGQALAGGWARYTGNDGRHWEASWGNGC